jgi:hypothetical protein
VRACATQTGTAQRAGVCMTAEFREAYPGGAAIPLFNRFCFGPYYRRILNLCRTEQIPFLVDIDDLFWELPTYSSDQARHDDAYIRHLERLCGSAWGLIASTPYLRQRLQERFPGKPVFPVENSLPAWQTTTDAALIANTDALKLSRDDTVWFAKVVFALWNAGVGIQLIGENDALTDSWLEPYTHGLARLPYNEYLMRLNAGKYCLGLIPVERSPYADAKSPVKLIEFVSSGIPVIASDTAPHRQFLRDHPALPVTLVDNTEPSWQRAIASFIATRTPEQILAGQRVNHLLHDARSRQLTQWRDVYQNLPADPGLSRKTARLRRYCQRRRCLDLLRSYLAPVLALRKPNPSA